MTSQYTPGYSRMSAPEATRFFPREELEGAVSGRPANNGSADAIVLSTAMTIPSVRVAGSSDSVTRVGFPGQRTSAFPLCAVTLAVNRPSEIASIKDV